MSNFIKKLFGTLAEKPWEKEQAVIDTNHPGKTFNDLFSFSNLSKIILNLFKVIGHTSGQ